MKAKRVIEKRRTNWIERKRKRKKKLDNNKEGKRERDVKKRIRVYCPEEANMHARICFRQLAC